MGPMARDSPQLEPATEGQRRAQATEPKPAPERPPVASPRQERPQQPPRTRVAGPGQATARTPSPGPPRWPVLWGLRHHHRQRERGRRGGETVVRPVPHRGQTALTQTHHRAPGSRPSLTSMMTVASSRVGSNIFFSCLKGPIRKHVLWERAQESHTHGRNTDRGGARATETRPSGRCWEGTWWRGAAPARTWPGRRCSPTCRRRRRA